MNQQPGPSTPQRVYVTGPAMAADPNAMNMRATIVNQSPAFINSNRSYSPQTPVIQQQVGAVGRTPIQMIQQATQNIGAPSASVIGSPASASGGAIRGSKHHAAIAAQPSPQPAAQQMMVATAAGPNAAVGAGFDSFSRTQNRYIRKKGKLKDKIVPQKVRELVPESQSYMDLLAFERKLDATIMRKRLDIQEALKRPIKIKRKLRVFITNQFYPGKVDGDNEEDNVPQWELKIEGRLLEDNKADPSVRIKPRKFSSFFKSLVIELDKDLYGPDNHLVEWHRTPQTAETDGFQVKRHGDQTLKCTILMLLDYQPPQFKLDMRLSKLLGIHTATRPVIIQALWQYIKNHKLQDAQEKEFINLDKYLQQIFDCERIRFSDIPNKLHMLCAPPDPIVINHMINIEANEPKRTSIYDIDVEIDDTIRDAMKSFLTTSQTQSLAEIGALDSRINELIDQANQLRLSREFYMAFSDDPQEFINKWLVSQSNDLKQMLDLNGCPEEERRANFYHESWTDEAVSRYFYNKVTQKRAELEQVLGIR